MERELVNLKENSNEYFKDFSIQIPASENKKKLKLYVNSFLK